MIGLVGKKIGMTRIFTEDGVSIPVTVIKIDINQITQIKSLLKDGYQAIQVTTGKKKNNRINKAKSGQFSKAGIQAGEGLWEFRTKKEDMYKVGQKLSVKIFNNYKKVDVTGISKGKGFSGTVKRWNFRTQDASHGNSLSHRVPGSIGQNQSPGKVFKGKKMAGQLGNKQITIQNLPIARIDENNNLLLIKGSVPGSIGNRLLVKVSVKISEE
ncbi:50S ribosomal protein L3 [Candidatus Tachikawaea gelatinosa]|uniref:Large ribosomal subunit protein uL3 n=1 Tax=Candidatus Tachikawaea gelatinosa TaxID=1410383 RepID=A0A090ARH1_9ENTR|nr:50S ribosomal protein L3 [Candidatus Tachikawaea gelatinosa]BAP58375.1 50S ribosomal protein L3 [Candidatus Tachikawaea gelatinosa]